MPKTTSQWLLKHYPPLREIPEEEWDEVFDRDHEPWSAEDDEYVQTWSGKERVLNIAYALGRTPWKVQHRAKRLKEIRSCH